MKRHSAIWCGSDRSHFNKFNLFPRVKNKVQGFTDTFLNPTCPPTQSAIKLNFDPPCNGWTGTQVKVIFVEDGGSRMPVHGTESVLAVLLPALEGK